MKCDRICSLFQVPYSKCCLAVAGPVPPPMQGVHYLQYINPNVEGEEPRAPELCHVCTCNQSVNLSLISQLCKLIEGITVRQKEIYMCKREREIESERGRKI